MDTRTAAALPFRRSLSSSAALEESGRPTTMGKGKKSMRKFAKQGGVKKAIAKRRSAQGKRQVHANIKQERRAHKQKAKSEGEAALGRTLERKRAAAGAAGGRRGGGDGEGEGDGEMDGFAGMSMDDFMSGKFLEDSGDE